MLQFLKENATAIVLLSSAVTQIYSAAKIIAKNEHTVAELKKFRSDYDEHVKNYNSLARDVAFLQGKDAIR